MGPRGSYALGSATYERAPKAMGSTCTVTSPGPDSISAPWTQARLLLTLASAPRTDSSRYLSWRLWGAACPRVCAWARVPPPPPGVCLGREVLLGRGEMLGT